jgi:hypothetical protein
MRMVIGGSILNIKNKYGIPFPPALYLDIAYAAVVPMNIESKVPDIDRMRLFVIDLTAVRGSHRSQGSIRPPSWSVLLGTNNVIQFNNVGSLGSQKTSPDGAHSIRGLKDIEVIQNNGNIEKNTIPNKNINRRVLIIILLLRSYINITFQCPINHQ